MKNISIVLILFISSCANAEHSTPQKYRYIDTTNKITYNRIGKAFVDSIYSYVCLNKKPFDNVIYNCNTRVIIDTLLLNPQENESIFFVITDNSKNSVVDSERKGRNYDAFCFTAKFQNGSWKFISMGPFFYDNFYSKEEISRVVRHAYFSQLSGQDYKGQNNYNMDDKRYWDESIWDKFNNR